MFTLQILDRGQTFLHPIDGAPVLLGSDPEAHVVLGEEGVAGLHARIEPAADGASLVALAPLTVNGRAQTRAELALGDRIELGRAVIVVGRTVARQGRPDDVLADAVLRRPRAARARRTPWPALAMLALAVAGGAWWYVGREEPRVGEQIAAVQRARWAGQLPEARALIGALQQEWAQSTDDRLPRLDRELAAVAAAEGKVRELAEQIAAPHDARGYAEWSQELQRLEHDGTAIEQVAARHLRERLVETLRLRPRESRAPVAAPVPPPAPVPTPPAAPVAVPQPETPAATRPTEPASPPAARPAEVATAPSPASKAVVEPTSKVDLTEVERLHQAGLFAQAIALLEASLAEAENEAEGARLQQRVRDLRAHALLAMRGVLAEAEKTAAAGRAVEAARFLGMASHRFPATAEFAPLESAQRGYERQVPALAADAAPDEATRAATLVALRARMDTVRQAEERGDFEAAALSLHTAAKEVGDRDPDFAGRLEARAAEAELLAAWHDTVAAAVRGGRKFSITSARGALEVGAIDGSTLVAEPGGVRSSWFELDGKSVAAIAEQLAVTGRPALGAAALLYKQGEATVAEALLARALRGDAGLKATIDRVIARGRGEPLDPRGYALDKAGFQSVRSLEVQKQAQQLATRVEAALRDKNPKARETLVRDALKEGKDAAQVLAAALQKELTKQIQRIDTGAFRKKVEKLAALRTQLDAARAHAKELIFDETRYFYPFKPPAVSSDRYAEYARVQAEVDRRVAALRTLWSDDRERLKVPSSLRVDLDRLDWLASSLDALGELEHGQLAPLEWARALPAGDSVGLREFCTTSAERRMHEEWQHVEAYDAIVGKSLTAAQREQLAVTNEYRRMFGHRPLAVVLTVCDAAQGHAEEMSRLGYFAHMSPTPGRRTPYDRMKLAGYGCGVSENIALADGAYGAHSGWCQSSGHHRNLLNPDHREFGIGADGRYWVQNFGTGLVHRDDVAWKVSAPRR